MVKLLHSPELFWDLTEEDLKCVWPAICLDFNGVLDQYHGWQGRVYFTPPAPGVEEFLQQIRQRFKSVVILTATRPLEQVVEWLRQYELAQYVDYVTHCKIPAECYVDDLAVRHEGNFEDTLQRILTARPHWEVNNGHEPRTAQTAHTVSGSAGRGSPEPTGEHAAGQG